MLPSVLVPARSRRRPRGLHVNADDSVVEVPLPRRPFRSRNCRSLREERERQLRRQLRQKRESVARHREETAELERQLTAMREHVAQLERRRSLLASASLTARANVSSHALAQVRQFYALFSHGFDPETRPGESEAAASFLRSAMTPDVLCAEFRGVDTFLTQYRVCTAGHQSMRVLLQEAVVVAASDSGEGEGQEGQDVVQVRANAVARFRVSRETLRRFFPRIAGDEALTQRLVGKQYVLQYDKVFHFRGGRVFQHESKVDLVNSLLTMVQDPFVAAKLLEAWVMTKHGHLKVDAQVVEGGHELEGAVLPQ